MVKRRNTCAYFLLFCLLQFIIVNPGSVLATAGSTGGGTSQFSDVGSNNSNLVYINYVTAKGIMSGFPDGSFHPGEGLTRAQGAVIISKAANLNVTDKVTGFKDVAPGYWGAGYIAAAVKAGYLKGMPDGTFRPEDYLTRAQGISLVLRLSKQVDPGTALPEFTDMSPTHWAARSMAIAIDAGMIDAPNGNSIQPDSPVSRGDISQALAILLTSDPDLNKRALYSTMTVKNGTVKLTRGSGEAKLVSDSVPVGAGDTIVTGQNGEAVINYPDGSSLLLNKNSTLTIKESQGRAYIKKDGQPGTAVDNLEVELAVGEMFGGLSSLAQPNTESQTGATGLRGSRLLASNAEKHTLLAAGGTPWYKTAQQQKVKVKVDMPWGIAAIRGSFWNSFVNGNGSGGTNLLEGSASVIAGGQTVGLSPGQSTSGSSGGAPPSAPTQMSSSQLSQWSAVSSWVQSTFASMSSNQGSGEPGTPGTPGAAPDPGAALGQTLNQAMGQANQAAAEESSNASAGESAGGGGGGHGSSQTGLACSISTTQDVYYFPNMFPGPTGPVPGKIAIPITVSPSGASVFWAESGADVVDVSTSGSVPAVFITSKQDAPGCFRSGRETLTFTVSAAGYTSVTKTIDIYALPPLGVDYSYISNTYIPPVALTVYDDSANLWLNNAPISLQFIEAGSNDSVVDTSGNPVSATVSAVTDSDFTFSLNSVLPVGQYEYVISNNCTPVAIAPFKVIIDSPPCPITLQPWVFAGTTCFSSLNYPGAAKYMFRYSSSDLAPPSLGEDLNPGEWVTAKVTTASPYDPGSPFPAEPWCFVQVVAVDASNRALACSSHQVTLGEIAAAPAQTTFTSGPTLSKGLWVLSTHLDAISDPACSSSVPPGYRWMWQPASFASTNTVPAASLPYTTTEYAGYIDCSTIDIGTVLLGLRNGYHIGFMGVDSGGNVVIFQDYTVAAAQIASGTKAPTLDLDFNPGAGSAETCFTVNTATTGVAKYIVCIKPGSESPPFNVAKDSDASSLGSMTNAGDIIYPVAVGYHVWVFGVDASGIIKGFVDHEIDVGEVN